MTPERIARLRGVLDRRQPDLTVVTDFVHKQRNLSAIVRNCDAAGVARMHAVIGDEDYTAFRGTSMGSHSWVEVVRYSCAEDALTKLRSEGYQVVAAHLEDDAVDYRDVDYTVPTALVMGAERRGLSASAANYVDRCITIPMVGMVESFNVSVAAGIILAEAQRQRQIAGLYDSPRLDPATYDKIYFEWGHAAIAQFCRERGLAYPPLNAEGEIDNPSDWYASVRRGDAPRSGANNG
ncbi:tRNA (guanosine(18)-2'-O)-methyltransferase TrmH [Halioglobus sp. HI00S01]|uniref:tRNA (guanosine(18)-2'-O)-methyltransferase TrmH n=1 Tax=Halioglobus sp. HI00S01 TaxID=1822214 RepID=UPI0007C319BB|nr:tRNA (guanosine(18)-2'-O)-methyltransferase TrmH [Halioglobus sp. HI00S01]KZX59469.1 tRNA (guanosine(18)-2'-O)-methyltransferase TrmH [Halioglobus sp. HI00S01]